MIIITVHPMNQGAYKACSAQPEASASIQHGETGSRKLAFPTGSKHSLTMSKLYQVQLHAPDLTSTITQPCWDDPAQCRTLQVPARCSSAGAPFLNGTKGVG